MTKKQYDDLASQINYHMDLYYNKDEPEISDYEYDQLMSSLKEAEREHPEWVSHDSPTQRIGGVAKREAGVKVTHDVPMLSIEDVFTKEAVVAWVDKVKFLHPEAAFSVEEKIDGLSATLRYERKEDGLFHLVLCETRGDGLIGEDVTENAKAIPDIPQTMQLPIGSDFVQLRGEVYMTHENFNAYNAIQKQYGKKLAANPRNLAAGTLRQLNPNIVAERKLNMKIFNVQKGPSELMRSHVTALELLETAGFNIALHSLCETSDEVWDTIETIGRLRNGMTSLTRLDHDIDGAVVKLNNISYRDDFPAGSKYSAGHIAYKYPPEERIVVIDDIVVDVGRTGKLTYTGVFHDKLTGKPAQLCGTSVSRVTLHNQDYINQMKIGIGGEYKLFKSGEIIPKLNGCVKEPDVVFMAPKVCPVCGESLIKFQNDAPDIYCANANCPTQISRSISYFVSRDCMDIAGLGDTIIDELVKRGFIKNITDIYKLHLRRDALIKDGIIGREKNTDKVLSNIEASKKREAYRVLCGLGIPNVGKTTAKAIMKHFSNILDLAKAEVDDVARIDDVGSITAKSIKNFFVGEINIVKELESLGVNMASEITSSGDKFVGKTFVITGTLPTLSRQEATTLIEKNGGKVAGSVSKKTDYVLAGDAAGAKLTKANDLGITIIDETKLKAMLS